MIQRLTIWWAGTQMFQAGGDALADGVLTGYDGKMHSLVLEGSDEPAVPALPSGLEIVCLKDWPRVDFSVLPPNMPDELLISDCGEVDLAGLSRTSLTKLHLLRCANVKLPRRLTWLERFMLARCPSVTDTGEFPDCLRTAILIDCAALTTVGQFPPCAVAIIAKCPHLGEDRMVWPQ